MFLSVWTYLLACHQTAGKHAIPLKEEDASHALRLPGATCLASKTRPCCSLHVQGMDVVKSMGSSLSSSTEPRNISSLHVQFVTYHTSLLTVTVTSVFLDWSYVGVMTLAFAHLLSLRMWLHVRTVVATLCQHYTDLFTVKLPKCFAGLACLH